MVNLPQGLSPVIETGDREQAYAVRSIRKPYWRLLFLVKGLPHLPTLGWGRNGLKGLPAGTFLYSDLLHTMYLGTAQYVNKKVPCYGLLHDTPGLCT